MNIALILVLVTFWMRVFHSRRYDGLRESGVDAEESRTLAGLAYLYGGQTGNRLNTVVGIVIPSSVTLCERINPRLFDCMRHSDQL